MIVAVCGVAYYLKSRRRRREDRPQRAMSDEEYNRHRHQDQQRVDAILDKISRKGLESLSKEEKNILENYH